MSECVLPQPVNANLMFEAEKMERNVRFRDSFGIKLCLQRNFSTTKNVFFFLFLFQAALKVTTQCVALGFVKLLSILDKHYEQLIPWM